MSEVFSRDTIKELSVADMLDMRVDQVEELQELVTVNSFIGTFRVNAASMEQGEGEEKGYFAMRYETLDIAEREQANPHNLADAQVGMQFTERFYPGYGVQRLMMIIGHLMGKDATLRDFLEKAEGLEFQALIHGKARKDKDTKETRTFNELSVHNMTGPCTEASE